MRPNRQLSTGLILSILILLSQTLMAQTTVAQGNWPQFRGQQASGVADAPNLPIQWDRDSGHNIKWRTPIAGLGLSSPVVWGNKVFLTNAVGVGKEQEDVGLRVGLYGDVDPVEENFPHHFQVLCLDLNTGKVLWTQNAHTGVPQVKRHTKASHANATVATDGRYVVAFFGSEGLFCYDLDGKLIWKKDLGYLNSAFFRMPEAQWGFASSPVIHDSKVVVQCDVMDSSFVAALDIKTGQELWRTYRNEEPTWCTPTIAQVNGRWQAILNGWHRRGAYDLETGKEIWFMDNGGDIPTPTPIIAHDMAFFSSAHGRVRPLYAIKLEAQGDITLKGREESNDYVLWSNPRRGAYMNTPLVLGDYLYVGNGSGILTCYEAKTGKEVYREKLGNMRGAYTGSAVASQDKLYYVEESGLTHVVQAGPEYKHLAVNNLGESILTTPAIAGKTLLIRTAKALYAMEDSGKTMEQTVFETEAEIKDVPPMPQLPKDQLTDATEILKLLDGVAKATHTIQYTLTTEATGVMGARTPQGTVTVTESGWGEFTAGRFKVEGQGAYAGMPEPMTVKAGSDGNRFYLIEEGSQTIHADYEFGVFGRKGGVVYYGLIREFVMENPFDDEINAQEKTLEGIEEVEGEPCYKINLAFAESGNKSSYWVSTKDFALRKRHTDVVMENGQTGSTTFTLSNVKINPDLDKSFYALPEIEGYSIVTEPPQ